MQSWLSYHLYPLDADDIFIVRAVRPFLEQHVWAHKGRRAFFTRYDDEKGRHVRLRLRGQADEDVANELTAALQAWMTDRAEVVAVPYEPEPERFGGADCLSWAEEYFHVSTRVVLDRLARPQHTYGDSLFDALRLHLITAFAAGFDAERTTWYFDRLCEQWMQLFFEPKSTEEAKKIFQQFERSFEGQRQELAAALSELWAALRKGKFDTEQPEWLRWLRGNELILPEFGDQLERALPSLLHLTNNRLGVGNEDEVFLNYILSRAI